MDWPGVLYVIVTADDTYPTWLPGVLPVWTSAELVDAFLDRNALDAMPAELSDGPAVELLHGLQSCGCTTVCVDPVSMDDDVATVPIQNMLSELAGEEMAP